MDSVGKIRIETFGGLFIRTPDDLDVTPRSTFCRAILGILAVSPHHKASRRFIEELLWPNRGQEQASGSLRQALTQTRRALGEYASILEADRLDVSLDSERVTIDQDLDHTELVTKIQSAGAFLEGVEIRSTAFEDWVAQQRMRLEGLLTAPEFEAGSLAESFEPVAPSVQRPTLYTQDLTSSPSLEGFIADAVCAQLSRTTQELTRTNIIQLENGRANEIIGPGGKCTIRVVRHGGSIRALGRLSEEPTGRVIWTNELLFPAEDEMAAVDGAAALALEAAEAFGALQLDASVPARANAMANAALSEIFSFDPERLLYADQLLKEAQDLDPHAPRPALRALGKAFLAVEQPDVDAQELRSEADILIAEAMRLDPNNAIAMAFVADVYDLVFQDPNTALNLVENAIQRNPGTGYAYASLGSLELRRNRQSNALENALRAKRQLSNTSMETFALMRFCVAAMSAGQFEAAQNACKRAHLLSPESRPPLRHLYALNLKIGDMDGARRTLLKLREIEPEFSMSFLRESPEFPAATLRATGLVKLRDVDL